MAAGVSGATLFDDLSGQGAKGSLPPTASRDAGSAGDRPQAGSSRLDYKAINGSGSSHGDELLVLPCKCRNWACRFCGASYWAKISHRLRPHLGIFKRPRLLTLTLDRKRFESGQAAYEHVQGQGLIRRFLRLIGFRKGFSVMAFHPEGREWPHWHILVDLADLGAWVDLAGMWSLWRDRWGCGGLDLNTKEHEYQTAAQAAHYILSYCQHQAGVVGDWVLSATRLPRAYEVYGELRSLLRKSRSSESADPSDDSPPESPESTESTPSSSPDEPDGEPKQKRPRSLSRSVRERLNECGKTSTLMLRQEWGDRTVYQYLGKLEATPGHVALANKLGMFRSSDVRTRTRELPNGETLVEPYIPLGKTDAKKQAETLKNEMKSIVLSEQSLQQEMARLESEAVVETTDWADMGGQER